MMRAGCRSVLFWLVSASAFLFPILPALATDTEQREFTIFVDGKDSGRSKMTIVQKDDGSSYMKASLDVKFRRLIGEYTLKIDTEEWWKDGRLIGMETKCIENNKRTEVFVAVDEKQTLRIRVNGQARMLKTDVWTNSYWKLAEARFHNKQVPVLEVDSGKELNCELKYLGTKQLMVANQLQDCYHFRVTGGAEPVEIWYDRYHRLVRQESVELGHKTIVQLVVIRR